MRNDDNNRRNREDNKKQDDCKRNNNNLEFADEIAIDRDCRDNREENCRKKDRER